MSVMISFSARSMISPAHLSPPGRCAFTMSSTGSLASTAAGMFTAIRRLTPSFEKATPALSALLSDISASLLTLDSCAPGMKASGNATPYSG